MSILMTCKNGEMQNQAAVSIGMDQEPIHLYYTVCFTILKDFEALEEPDSFIPSRIISKSLPVWSHL